MNFDLEDQLRDTIFFSRGGEMARRGLGCYIHNYVIPEFKLGKYGRADLVGFSFFNDEEAGKECDITIYELKLKELNIDTISQVCRYKHAFERYIDNEKRFNDYIITLRTVLVGKYENPTPDFKYICSGLDMNFYTYELTEEGIEFKLNFARRFDLPDLENKGFGQDLINLNLDNLNKSL